MWPAKQIDISWSDLAFAAATCFSPGRAAASARQLEERWAAEEGLACLSVRTGFDLLWAALDLPAGSEVLMSAVTIPDMVRIVQQHRLTPIPIDLDLETLAPRQESIEEAVTPRTRAIVVAHLFGSRVPMGPILELARRHGLPVIEDLAQGFAGPNDRGHPDSDMALFSFGTIKTATALGGALLRVRDRELLARMRAIAADYPLQPRRSYLQRVLKYATFKAGLI
ncbi:MAG TPA: DegT/DnrJ/EryC1/StrS family aminotransferase, partial [Pirellulaceae bacterium]|nr:DegT/DnrJ/EryC1/StrS family aminotransferase [Pirellulaceae bacterium]